MAKAKKKGAWAEWLEWRSKRRAKKAKRLAAKAKRKAQNRKSTGTIRQARSELRKLRDEGRDARQQRATARWQDKPNVFRPEPAAVKLTPVSIFRGEVVGGHAGAGVCGFMDTADGRPCQNLVDESTPACSAGHPNAQARRGRKVARR